jgi:Leucine-rich repeat (LRR) protein
LQLERLKSKSILENLDGRKEVGMHDLWREFAIMKSKGGEFDSRPWIYEKIYGPNDSRREEPKLSRSGGWENVQRICLVGDTERGCPVKEIDLGCYSNLRVLKLVDVYTNTEILDVSALTQLRSLQISYPVSEALEILGLGCLRSLVFLDLDGLQVRKASFHEEIGALTSLQALSIQEMRWRSPLSILLDFSRLNLLRDVNVEKVDKITGLSSRMTNLKCLQLRRCSSLRSCHGVGDLVALEELDLSGCTLLEELPNLGRLKHLLKLNITSCVLIEVVSGLGDLVSLQEFRAGGCSKLAELPKMCKLFNLQRLRVCTCPLLGAIPGLSDVVGLEELWADSRGLEECHDLCKLTKLESVQVYGWDAEGLPCLADLVNLKSLRIFNAVELTGLLDLTRIERLSLMMCYFERLPDLHKLPRLEELEIWDCYSWTEWKIGSGLRLFGADPHIAGTFPHLKILELWGLALAELPDLSSFPQLSEFTILGCRELTSLTSSAPLTALKRLDLSGCDWLRALPDVSHLVSLSTLRLCDCRKLKLTAHEMEKLQTMCPGLILDLEHDDEIDSDVESEPDDETHSDMEPELDDEGDPDIEPELDDVRDAKRPKFVELI